MVGHAIRIKECSTNLPKVGGQNLVRLLGRGVYVYIDDILIYTETIEEQWRLLN